ncbi:hypothetical protein ABPG74_022768 [Tetrahymena malaccensis]
MAKAILQLLSIILISCISQSLGYVVFNKQNINISSQPTTLVYNGYYQNIAIEIVLDSTLQLEYPFSLAVQCSGIILIDTYNTKLSKARAFFQIPGDCMQPMAQFQIYALSKNDIPLQTSVKALIQWKGESEPGLKICPFNCNDQGSCNQSTGICECRDFLSGYDCSYGQTQISPQTNVEAYLGNYFMFGDQKVQFLKLFSNQQQNYDFCEIIPYGNVKFFIAPVNSIEIKNYNQTLQSMHESKSYFDNNLIVLYTDQPNSFFEIYLECSSEYQVTMNQSTFFIIVFTVLPFLIFIIVLIQRKCIQKKKQQPQQQKSDFEKIKEILESQGEEKKMTFEEFIKGDFPFKEIKQCSKCFKEFDPNQKVILTKLYQLIHDQSYFQYCQNKINPNKRFSSQQTQNCSEMISNQMQNNLVVDDKLEKSSNFQIKDSSSQLNMPNQNKEQEQLKLNFFQSQILQKNQNIQKIQNINSQFNQVATSQLLLCKTSIGEKQIQIRKTSCNE